MIELQSHADGTVLLVSARAGARRNEVGGVHEGMLRVSVTQAPERGKANKAVVALLARTLGLRKSQIELVAGETHPQKRFLIRGMTAEDLSARIERIV